MPHDPDPSPDSRQALDATAATSRALAIAVVVLGAIVLYVLRAFVAPMIVGAWFAAIASPAIRRILGRSGRGGRFAGIATFLLVMALVLPIALLALPIAQLITEASSTLFHGSASATLRDWIARASQRVPDHRAHAGLAEVWDFARRIVPEVTGVASRALRSAFATAVQLLVLIASTYVFTANGREIVAWTRRGLPLAPEHFDRLVRESLSVARALLVGGLLTAVAQGLVASVVYALIDVRDAVLLGVLTGIASVVPIVGTALVWAPVCAILFGSGRIRDAIILLACGVLIIGTVDNVLRPFLARLGAREIHPLVLFLGVFGGLTTFGPWGLVTGPLALALFLAAFRLRAELRPDGSARATTPVADR